MISGWQSHPGAGGPGSFLPLLASRVRDIPWDSRQGRPPGVIPGGGISRVDSFCTGPRTGARLPLVWNQGWWEPGIPERWIGQTKGFPWIPWGWGSGLLSLEGPGKTRIGSFPQGSLGPGSTVGPNPGGFLEDHWNHGPSGFPGIRSQVGNGAFWRAGNPFQTGKLGVLDCGYSRPGSWGPLTWATWVGERFPQLPGFLRDYRRVGPGKYPCGPAGRRGLNNPGVQGNRFLGRKKNVRGN